MSAMLEDPLYENVVASRVRMLVLGSAEPSFYQAADEDRPGIESALTELFAVWQRWGATCLGTFDDDVLMVGTPRARKHHFTLIYEVDGLEMAGAMMNLFRREIEGIRLSRYFRFESSLGRGFFPVEAAESASAARSAPSVAAR